MPGYIPPPPRKNTGKIIALIVAFAVVVTGTVVAMLVIKQGDDQHTSTAPASRTDDNSGPDSGVLEQRITSGATSYGAMVAFDTCAVPPATVLETAGFPTYPRGRRVQVHLPTSMPPEKATLSKVSEQHPITSCTYSLPGKKSYRDAEITLSIIQFPLNTGRLAVMPERNETQGAATAGLNVFTSESEAGTYTATIGAEETTFTATLRSGDLAANYNGIDDKTIFRKLVDLVAANLAKGPTDRVAHSFGGRYQGVPNACDVLTSELFATQVNGPDSGIAEYEAQTAELNTEQIDHSHTKSVQQKCVRTTPDRMANFRKDSRSLRMTLETYRDETMAKKADISNCDPEAPMTALHGDPVTVNDRVGDGLACVIVVGVPNYAFRVGRTEVTLVPSKSWLGEDLKTIATKLTPTAKAIAEELRRKS
jgi:hypothetical protein